MLWRARGTEPGARSARRSSFLAAPTSPHSLTTRHDPPSEFGGSWFPLGVTKHSSRGALCLAGRNPTTGGGTVAEATARELFGDDGFAIRPESWMKDATCAEPR